MTVCRKEAGYSCWNGVSEASLAEALNPPTVLCIEAGARGNLVANMQHIRADRVLGLLVTARSAFGRPIARLFVAALAQRLPLCPMQKHHIHTALHEALGNAVLHGNLGVGPRLLDDVAGLEAARAIIDSRLAADELGLSSIRLDASWTGTTLYVAVRDSGHGFQPVRDQRLPDDGLYSGRGLFILRALCHRVRHFAGGTGIMLGFVL